MTIEEYLKSEAEYIERMLSEEDDLEASSYLEGKRDAYREILDKLPSFEHEVTLREFVSVCKSKNSVDIGCPECPWRDMCFVMDDERCAGYPYCLLDVDDIQKRMKEARSD